MRLEQTAFALDRKPITVGEVLAAALLGGFVAPLSARVADGFAAASLAAEREFEATEEEIQAALDAWRVNRDLIAADEFNAWMDASGFTLEDVVEHLEREVLRRRIAALAPRELEKYRPPLADFLGDLHAEAVLGGELEGLVTDCAYHAVSPTPPEGSAPLAAAARLQLLAALGAADTEEAAGLVQVFGVEAARARELLEAEVAFAVFRADMRRDDVLQQALPRERDQLVRYRLATATFVTEDVAREAMCCLREDRDTFSRAAARAGEADKSSTLLPSDLASLPFGHRIPPALPREVFGPLAADDGRYLVAQLVERVEPDLASDDVRDELARRLVRRALNAQVMERVVFAVARAA